MSTPPPEILMAIIHELTADTPPSAYTFSSEVKSTLRSLTLVSYSCHELSTPPLYGRVTVAQDEIARLKATLSPATPRASSLTKQIHTLRLTVPYTDSFVQTVDPEDWAVQDMDVAEAAALLHLLAPHASLKRLFVDMALICDSPYSLHLRYSDLHNAISSITSLSELVLGNLEDRTNDFFWMIELDGHPYDCFAVLETVTILDVNVEDPPIRDVFRRLANVKEMVLIRPWLTDLDIGGEVLADLFSPGRGLQSLIIVLASGWDLMPLQQLTIDDLGPVMVPHRDKVLILSESEAQGTLLSWETIRDMIGMGRAVLNGMSDRLLYAPAL
ncbi:hypothetical protein FRB93_012540 [Tulasnella sp. JGI-2019a]|nr:hypothetical protein FRB93_012540 [Tulasnella sp. JGI-2019a]